MKVRWRQASLTNKLRKKRDTLVQVHLVGIGVCYLLLECFSCFNLRPNRIVKFQYLLFLMFEMSEGGFR